MMEQSLQRHPMPSQICCAWLPWRHPRKQGQAPTPCHMHNTHLRSPQQCLSTQATLRKVSVEGYSIV